MHNENRERERETNLPVTFREKDSQMLIWTVTSVRWGVSSRLDKEDEGELWQREGRDNKDAIKMS
jgi:hypothetical protein